MMNSKKKFIFLIGFMASGKTTIGRLLAKKLGMPFYDTDDLIENEAKKSIPEIFKNDGEEVFREIESRILRNIINADIISNGIIATGGGMPCFNDNMALMKMQGITIYLKAPINDIIERINDADKRPVFKREMEKGELAENIKNLLELRKPFYNMADLIVESGSARSPFEIVDELIQRLKGI